MDYGNSILIPFELLFNTDLGLIKMVKLKYNNPKFINLNMLDIPDDIMANVLLQRESVNPLTVIVNDEYVDKVDSLLKEFMTVEYGTILDNSSKTDLFKLVLVFLKTNLISINILCKNQQEEQFIKKIDSLSKASTIIVEDLKDININHYDSIFIKNYRDILNIAGVEGKSIFVANYKFNIDPNPLLSNSPLNEINIIVGDVNKIFVIDVYDVNQSITIYG